MQQHLVVGQRQQRRRHEHLAALERPGRSYVGLDRITIEVTDPGAGVFICTLRIFGLFPYDEAAAPSERPAPSRSPTPPAERVIPAGGDRDI